MPRQLSALVLALALFVSSSAWAQFPSTKDTVGPRGPGGLDVPDATPPPGPPATPKKVEETIKKPVAPPASSSGY